MNPTDERVLLEALVVAGIAIELTQQEADEYGLMADEAVSLADALAAADEQPEVPNGS